MRSRGTGGAVLLTRGEDRTWVQSVPRATGHDRAIGVRELYAAVLWQAVALLTCPALAEDVCDVGLLWGPELAAVLAEEREWVLSEDRSEPFAYLSCCEVLDVDAERIRAWLRDRGALVAVKPLVVPELDLFPIAVTEVEFFTAMSRAA